MRKLYFSFLFIFAIISCGPIPLYVNIEMKKDSPLESLVDTDIALLTVNPKGDKDSLLLNAMANGFAEKFEEDRAIANRALPIYSLLSEEVNIKDSLFVDYISASIPSRYLFFIDSLIVADYIVDNSSNNRAYSEGEFFNQTKVMLPFSVSINLIDSYSRSIINSTNHKDSLVWTILGKGDIKSVEAVAKVNSAIKDAFKKYGNEIASELSPQWETQSRMVITYDNEKWLNAFDFAENFKWSEAIDIWLQEVKSDNPKKAAYAAYNIANAFEVLEQYDLAKKWLDFAKSKYHFREIEELRALIESSERSK